MRGKQRAVGTVFGVVQILSGEPPPVLLFFWLQYGNGPNIAILLFKHNPS